MKNFDFNGMSFVEGSLTSQVEGAIRNGCQSPPQIAEYFGPGWEDGEPFEAIKCIFAKLKRQGKLKKIGYARYELASANEGKKTAARALAYLQSLGGYCTQVALEKEFATEAATIVKSGPFQLVGDLIMVTEPHLHLLPLTGFAARALAEAGLKDSGPGWEAVLERYFKRQVKAVGLLLEDAVRDDPAVLSGNAFAPVYVAWGHAYREMTGASLLPDDLRRAFFEGEGNAHTTAPYQFYLSAAAAAQLDAIMWTRGIRAPYGRLTKGLYRIASF